MSNKNSFIVQEEKVYKKVIEVAKEIARKKEGALFIIGHENKLKTSYNLLFPQGQFSKDILTSGMDKVLEKLATLDGAVLIDNSGKLIAYGVKLKKTKALPGYGTKHSAARGTTEYYVDSVGVLVSEESNWIKIFKNGKVVLEMDEKETPKNVADKVASFLSSGDNALLAAAGVSIAAIGSPLMAPVAIIGGTYLAIKTATGALRGKFQK